MLFNSLGDLFDDNQQNDLLAISPNNSIQIWKFIGIDISYITLYITLSGRKFYKFGFLKTIFKTGPYFKHKN